MTNIALFIAMQNAGITAQDIVRLLPLRQTPEDDHLDDREVEGFRRDLTTVQRWVRGEQDPQTRQLQYRVARLLHVDASQLWPAKIHNAAKPRRVPLRLT